MSRASVELPKPQPQPNIAVLSDAVVTLIGLSEDGKQRLQGSAFFVDAGGTAITNWHVIKDAARVEAVTNAGARYPVSALLNASETEDLAIIQISAPQAVPSLRLHSLDDLSAGTRIITISTPEGLQQTVSDGLIAAKREENGRTLLQITAPISHGSSGGPVLDQSGEVVGIVVGLFEQGQNLNFAIPAAVAQRLLSQVQSSARLNLPAWPVRPTARQFSATYEQGLAAFQQGDYQKAASLFGSAQQLDPKNAAAHFAAAISWDQLNELEHAESAYKQYLSLNPDDPERVKQARTRLTDMIRNKRRLTGLLQNIQLDATIYFVPDGTLQGFVTIDSTRWGTLTGKYSDKGAAFLSKEQSGDRIVLQWDGNLDTGQHSGTLYYVDAGSTDIGTGDDFSFWMASAGGN